MARKKEKKRGKGGDDVGHQWKGRFATNRQSLNGVQREARHEQNLKKKKRTSNQKVGPGQQQGKRGKTSEYEKKNRHVKNPKLGRGCQ